MSDNIQRRPILVSVFLRGGANALALVGPYADAHYRERLPSLSLLPPDDARGSKERRALDLDGTFGMHPALEPLHALYEKKELAIVHAVGSDDRSRSHFEAQDCMDHGATRAQPEGSGWISRLLAKKSDGGNRSLEAVAIGAVVPESLRGASVAAITSADQYRIGPGDTSHFAGGLRALYEGNGREADAPYDEALREAARAALDHEVKLRAMAPAKVDDRRYPDTALGRGLFEVARLVRADLGITAFTVDQGGWDTHFVESEVLPPLARDLGASIAAFLDDLGDRRRDVTLLVMSEFGRRAYENASLGTDHGSGGLAFVLGEEVRGGRVYGDFPGLGPDDLEAPGDLRITTDYRVVLDEVATRIAPGRRLFPDLSGRHLGLFG